MSHERPFREIVGEISVVEYPVEVWLSKNPQKGALSQLEIMRSCVACSPEHWEMVCKLEQGSKVRVLSASYVLERGPGSVSEVLGLVEAEIPGKGQTRVQFRWRMGTNNAHVPWLVDG